VTNSIQAHCPMSKVTKVARLASLFMAKDAETTTVSKPLAKTVVDEGHAVDEPTDTDRKQSDRGIHEILMALEKELQDTKKQNQQIVETYDQKIVQLEDHLKQRDEKIDSIITEQQHIRSELKSAKEHISALENKKTEDKEGEVEEKKKKLRKLTRISEKFGKRKAKHMRLVTPPVSVMKNLKFEEDLWMSDDMFELLHSRVEKMHVQEAAK
jgi:chromosome segregation ATPase